MKLTDLTFVLHEFVGAVPLVAMITSCSGFPLHVELPGFTLHSSAVPDRLIARVIFGSSGYAKGCSICRTTDLELVVSMCSRLLLRLMWSMYTWQSNSLESLHRISVFNVMVAVFVLMLIPSSASVRKSPELVIP